MIIHIDFSLIGNPKEIQNYLDSLYHNVALKNSAFSFRTGIINPFPFGSIFYLETPSPAEKDPGFP